MTKHFNVKLDLSEQELEAIYRAITEYRKGCDKRIERINGDGIIDAQKLSAWQDEKAQLNSAAQKLDTAIKGAAVHYTPNDGGDRK